MRRATSVSFLILLAVSFSYLACDQDQVSSPKPYNEHLIIGLVPEQNVFAQKERYQVFMDYLAPKLGIQLSTRILDSYGRTYEEFTNGKVSAAFMGSYSTAMVLKLMPSQILARPVWLDGSSAYRGYVITLKDSQITSDVKTWKAHGEFDICYGPADEATEQTVRGKN